ncbi:MerR family transcriptional regulator [Spongisporangium articulatum]|uniref:MerR family transcriptional regulator n=1 Tax=Spongisporangium articulatum TaxID=3362603 RepID=A0ABW8AMJ3_9ACTN
MSTENEVSWSVGEVARAAGVTVRTLHHYDRIGLLSPGRRGGGEYREYGPDDVARLQRILAYRELGFGLDDVARLLDAPDEDPVARLRAQLALVRMRMEHLRQVAAVLEKTMEAHAMGIRLTPGEMLEVFGEHDPTEHAAEAEERWGDTDSYRESQRRTAGYTRDDWLAIKAEGDEILRRLAELKRSGAAADGSEATDAVEAHRQHVTRWFYELSKEAQVGLGEMYVADPRFTATYEALEPGLAVWVRDAIVANGSR